MQLTGARESVETKEKTLFAFWGIEVVIHNSSHAKVENFLIRKEVKDIVAFGGPVYHPGQVSRRTKKDHAIVTNATQGSILPRVTWTIEVDELLEE